MRNLLALLLLAPCALLAQVPDFVPTDGLVAWYPFDGNLEDHSLFENHLNDAGISYGPDRMGTENHCIQTDIGEYAYSNSFSGVSNASSLTISFWEKQSTFVCCSGDCAGGQIIISNQVANYANGIALHHGYRTCGYACPDGNCMGIDFYSNQLFTGSIADTSWKHWTLTYDAVSNSSKIYLNGDLISESSQPIFFTGGLDEGIVVGCVIWNVIGSYFRGSIDDMGIWNRELSASEALILSLGNSPSEGCLDSQACNFNPEANIQDDSCQYGCEFCGVGTVWDIITSTCVIANPTDVDLDGCTGISDILEVLSYYGICSDTILSTWSCGDPFSHWSLDYSTVQIGDQCWFQNNLRSALDSVGNPIGDHTYPGNDTANPNDYGILVDWSAAMSMCPAGWHLPSKNEFDVLYAELGGEAIAAGKLKNQNTTPLGWDGTNTSGFSALPTGLVNNASPGIYSGFGSANLIWSSTSYGFNSVYRYAAYLISGSDAIQAGSFSPAWHGSVRCLKD